MPTKRKPGIDRAFFQAAIKRLDEVELRIGYFESAKYDDPKQTPIAYVAAIQENGVPARNIPPRPFFAPTVRERKSEWNELFDKGARQLLKGKINADQLLDKLGLQAAGDIKRTISTLTDPPLSPLTLALRRFVKDGGVIKGASTVGEVARRMAAGEAETTGVSTKPLIDPRPGGGQLLAQLTHVVASKQS